MISVSRLITLFVLINNNEDTEHPRLSTDCSGTLVSYGLCTHHLKPRGLKQHTSTCHSFHESVQAWLS